MAHGFSDDKSKVNLTIAKYKGVGDYSTYGLPHGVPALVKQIDLPGPGTYIIEARLRFSGRSGGTRRIYLTPNSSPNTWQGQCEGTGNDFINTVIIHRCTDVNLNGTVYLMGYQNSGATINVTDSDVKYIRLYEDE